MSDVFVSYSRKDAAFTLALAESLREGGLDVWIDQSGIAPTAEWMAEIFSGIEGADHFLLVLSPAWAASEICLVELKHAVGLGKRIIPLLLEQPQQADLPTSVSRLQWVRFEPPGDHDKAAKAVEIAVRKDPDHVRFHTRILQRALQWRAGGEDASHLLRGKDLIEAEAWSQNVKVDPQPNDLQRAFIAASRVYERRRRRFLVALSATGVAAAAIGALVYMGERERSTMRDRIAVSRELASQAMAQLEDSHDLPLLLSLEAYRIHPTLESIDALHRALVRRPNLYMMLPTGSRRTTGLRFFDDGQQLAVGLEDGRLAVWNLATRDVSLSGRPYDRSVDHMAIDASFTRTIVSGSGALMGQSTALEAPLAPSQIAGAERYNALEVAFSPDGRWFASANGLRGAGASLWDVATWKEIRRFIMPGGFGADALAFSPDSKTLAVSGWDPRIALFDIASGDLIRVINTDADVMLDALAFGPNGKHLAYAHSDTVFVIDPDEPDAPSRLALAASGEARKIAFSPNGRLLAAAFDGGRVRVWDLSEGGPQHLFQDLAGYTEQLEFSPDSRLLAAGGYDGKVAVWDLEQIQQIGRLHARHSASVTALAISTDATIGASGSWDREIHLWQTGDVQKATVTLRGHHAAIYGLAFDSDRTSLTSVGSHAGPLLFKEPEIVRWNLTSDPPRPITPLPSPPQETGLYGLMRQIERMQGGVLAADPSASALRDVFPSAAVSSALARVEGVAPDGTRGVIRITLLAEGRQSDVLQTDHQHEIAALALADDASVLASAGIDHTVEIWDVAGRRRLRKLTGSSPCTSAQFSASGLHLAAACGNEILILSRPFESEDVIRLVGEGANIGLLAISPDGSRLVSINAKREISIWDVASRRAIGAPLTLDKPANVVAFGPSGQTAYTGDAGGKVIAWDLSVEGWSEVACRIAGRDLSPEEWTRFLGARPYHATCTGSEK